jgi:hypothetical protein
MYGKKTNEQDFDYPTGDGLLCHNEPWKSTITIKHFGQNLARKNPPQLLESWAGFRLLLTCR